MLALKASNVLKAIYPRVNARHRLGPRDWPIFTLLDPVGLGWCTANIFPHNLKGTRDSLVQGLNNKNSYGFYMPDLNEGTLSFFATICRYPIRYFWKSHSLIFMELINSCTRTKQKVYQC